MGRLRMAMFGAGRIGTYHFKNMLTSEQASISHILESDVERARALVDTYHMGALVQVVHIDFMHDVLDDTQIDAVMVCTPSNCHESIVIASLKAGKPVFCEKPLALSVAAVQECYRLAEDHKLPLMCGFNRRYDPQNRRIWKAVQSGTLGKVRMVKVTSRDPPSMINRPYLEISGGVFLDSCVHDISVAMWMAGEYPSTVYATGHATGEMFAECGDVDTAALTLAFPGGAVAQLEMSRVSPGSHDQRTEVLGTKSVMMSENKRAVDVVEYQLDRVHLEPIYETCDRYIESYREEIAHFVRVLKGEEKCEVLASDVLVTTIIAHACKTSLNERKVVDIKQYAKENFNYEIPY